VISKLDELNSAPDDATLRAALGACCTARAWVARVIVGRPYADRDALHRASDAACVELDDAGLAEALAGHPRIGERANNAWSRREQAGVSDADAGVRARLVRCNAAYEQRFGHVYLVCATGRTAEELLAVCESRLANDVDTERAVVLGELAKINRIRLDKLLGMEG
jgi:2-oxo-4-hydroxy-4-carboxy-5-ureidoimidazoline decarboxylase